MTREIMRKQVRTDDGPFVLPRVLSLGPATLHHCFGHNTCSYTERRVKYYDAETDKRFVFLTNLFNVPVLTIAMLYKARWQVELFFKWIKQHLRIKRFFGTTANAVKTQIWVAVSVYVLVAIVKKQLTLDQSLYTLLQILSLSLFERMPILQAFSQTDYNVQSHQNDNQLLLFNL